MTGIDLAAIVEPGAEAGEGIAVAPGPRARGKDFRLEIGAGNTAPEPPTMNPGTGGGGTATRVGADCRLVTGARVARHRRAGHRVDFAGMAWIAGHLAVGDSAIVGQLAGAARFRRAGARAIVASNTTAARAIIPRGPATAPGLRASTSSGGSRRPGGWHGLLPAVRGGGYAFRAAGGRGPALSGQRARDGDRFVHARGFHPADLPARRGSRPRASGRPRRCARPRVGGPRASDRARGTPASGRRLKSNRPDD